MPGSVLLIDDDPIARATVSRALQAAGWRVETAADGRLGVELYLVSPTDIVITDIDLPGLSGLQVIEILRARDPDAMLLVLTGHEELSLAVEALRLGAENYLPKPVRFELLVLAAERAREKASLRRHARRGVLPADTAATGDRSPALRRLDALVEAYAAATGPVLLTGAAGSGKRWLARRIHDRSPRHLQPFAEVHCAALAPEHHGVELFGADRPARPGSGLRDRGMLERARGGTLLLAEIDALAPSIQSRLASLLATGTIQEIGGTREQRHDVRIVATTSRDLEAEVRAGRFREDLYWLVSVLPLAVPTLADRGTAEVARLAQQFADAAAQRAGLPPLRLDDAALAALARHHWPGNVRELRNVVERAVALARGADVLGVAHLAEQFQPADARETPVGDDALALAVVERAHILRVLALCRNNKKRAAQLLGITRATLYARLAAYGVHGVTATDHAPRAA